MKKILFLLTICLAAVGQVFAESFTDEQGVTYEYAGAAGKIVGYDNKTPNVVITSPMKNGDDEFYVTTIAKKAFDSKTGLESIVLPEDLETIEEQAFYGCSMLYKVVFAEGTQLLEIGDRAFYNCTSLIDITITVRKSGSGQDEVSLPKIKSSGSTFYNFGNVPNIGFVNKTGRDIKGYPFGARNINGYVDGYLLYASGDASKTKVLLCSHAARGTVIIPESTTNIASQAFADCEQMTSVIIPASLSSIESRVFTGCKGLTSIVCKCTTPPVSPYYSDENPEFAGVNKSIPVYVPEGSIEAYKNAKGWSLFNNYQALTPETEEELSKVTLVLNANDPAMGTVTGAGVYESGKEVEIRATPAEGYKFVQWSDNNTENPRMILLTGNLTLTAVFADKNATGQFLLTLLVNDPSMGEVTGAGMYNEGDNAMIEAIAKEGYVFKQWSDGNKLSRRAIMMTANLTLTAEFAAASSDTPVTYTITVSSNDGTMGTVTGGGTYEPNAQFTLTATPNEGFVFVKWSDGNTDNPRTLTATANATFIAIFAKQSQGIEEVQGDKVQGTKVIENGVLYLMYKGTKYDVQGKRIY